MKNNTIVIYELVDNCSDSEHEISFQDKVASIDDNFKGSSYTAKSSLKYSAFFIKNKGWKEKPSECYPFEQLLFSKMS